MESSVEMNGVSARRQATRTRLVEAATEVFAAKGVHGASVEEICEHAGFTRGAFYSNYSGKNELLLDMLAAAHARFFDEVDLGDLRDLDSAIHAILSLRPTHRDFFLIQVELALHGIREPDFAPVALAAEESVLQHTRATLIEGLERLGLEPTLEIDDLAHLVLGVSDRSLRSALLSGDDDMFRLARLTLPGIMRAFTRPRST